MVMDKMTKCPVCGKGLLKKGMVAEEMFGTKLGRYEAEICNKCGESFIDERAMKKLEAKAKEMGVWGLAKKTKVIMSGNSLAVRIPSDIAKFAHLTKGIELVLHPEGKKKIVIEPAQS